MKRCGQRDWGQTVLVYWSVCG